LPDAGVTKNIVDFIPSLLHHVVERHDLHEVSFVHDPRHQSRAHNQMELIRKNDQLPGHFAIARALERPP
jgi:hypothetical protein